MKKENYDILIIGGGPAGLTAGIYAGRYMRKTLILAKGLGLTSNAGEVENWPGTEKIAGLELLEKFRQHAKKSGSEILEREVTEIKKEKKMFTVSTNDGEFKSKTIIFANGTEHRKLEIDGEEELVGKGVSYCATCDGMFFRNKEVIVVGGADSAAKAALYLAELAKKVTIVYRKEKLRCEGIYCQRIEAKKNIEIIFNAAPKKINGKNFVESLTIEQNKKEKTISASGIFVEIGSLPCNKLTGQLGIECDGTGYIKTDKSTRTNLEGAFAAGDSTNNVLKQIVTASAEGAIAANQAHEYLQRN